VKALKCNGSFRAYHDSGIRSLSPKYIVIHSTESPNHKGSARNVAYYFSKPIDDELPPSVQCTVDDYECYRSLPDDYIPWAAPPFNSRGLHVEQCGYAKWSRAEWLAHRATIDHAALLSARWSIAYSIPLLWLTVAGCKAHRSGITSHRNVSLAFGKSTHSDPGDPTENKHYPYDYFMAKVKAYSTLLKDA